MNKKSTFLILILVFVLLLGGAYILYQQLAEQNAPDQLAAPQTTSTENTTPKNTAPETTAAPKHIAPDFTVYDVNGNPVKLSDYFGKPIVLNFWASWCGPCKSEMPDFQEKYQELEGSVQFLMINMTDGSRETVETASAFLLEQGYTFPVFYDIDYDAAYTYGISSLPTSIFIDSEGNLVTYAISAIDAETLQRGIDMIR